MSYIVWLPEAVHHESIRQVMGRHCWRTSAGHRSRKAQTPTFLPRSILGKESDAGTTRTYDTPDKEFFSVLTLFN